jgi:hypothetical protein
MATMHTDVQLRSFLILALDGGQWFTPSPGRLTPGKEPRYPLNRRLGGRFEKEKNLLHLPGLESRTVQPVVQSFYRVDI